MLNFGSTELLVLLVLALLLLGPKRLPELARGLGRVFNEFRRAAAEVEQSLNEEKDKPAEQKPAESDSED